MRHPGSIKEVLKQQYPDNPDYYGTALGSQGRYDAAVAEINKALELNPGEAEAHPWFADVMDKQDRPARLEPGKLLINAGRAGQAIPALLPALQVDDSFTTVVVMFLAQIDQWLKQLGSAP